VECIEVKKVNVKDVWETTYIACMNMQVLLSLEPGAAKASGRGWENLLIKTKMHKKPIGTNMNARMLLMLARCLNHARKPVPDQPMAFLNDHFCLKVFLYRDSSNR